MKQLVSNAARHETACVRQAHDAHVVLLTNFIPPYRLPLLHELARQVGKLTILVSTPMESNRDWVPNWESLDVKVQKTWTFHRPWRHAAGFTDTIEIHVPRDTMGQLSALKPDVVISAEFGTRTILSALHTRRTRTTPLIVWATLSEQTERGRGWMRHVLRKWLVRQVDAVLVNGSSGSRYLQRLGLEQQRIFEVPQPAVPLLFEQLPVTRPRRIAHRLISTGQLSERKGLMPFLATLARWAAKHPDRHTELTLVGTGPLEQPLREFTTPENLSIRLAGSRSYEQLAEHYADAGIFVFPTLADEWGLVVNEALAAGLPVLGSLYSQAVEDLCVDDVHGWTFRPDNADEMEQALDRALSTPVEKLDEMRRAARAQVEHLTPAFSADRIVDAIHASLERRS